MSNRDCIEKKYWYFSSLGETNETFQFINILQIYILFGRIESKKLTKSNIVLPPLLHEWSITKGKVGGHWTQKTLEEF